MLLSIFAFSPKRNTCGLCLQISDIMDADKYTIEITTGELAGWGLHLERADFEVVLLL